MEHSWIVINWKFLNCEHQIQKDLSKAKELQQYIYNKIHNKAATSINKNSVKMPNCWNTIKLFVLCLFFFFKQRNPVGETQVTIQYRFCDFLIQIKKPNRRNWHRNTITWNPKKLIHQESNQTLIGQLQWASTKTQKGKICFFSE